MHPIVWLIVYVIGLLQLVLFVYIILNLLIGFGVVNARQPFVNAVWRALAQLCEPLLQPFRNMLSPMGGLDLSPILLFILLEFTKRIVIWYVNPLLAGV